MNIEQAKTIPICDFLDKLNIRPTKVTGHRATYLSPVRQEKTASFDVHTQKNVWFDRGLGVGGDIIALAQRYLESINEPHTVSDSLRFIENIAGYAPRIASVEQANQETEDPTLVITTVEKMKHKTLIQYLKARGISFDLARHYLHQVKVYNRNSGKHFFALGFKNEEESYELRNGHFKGCVHVKAVTFIRGTNETQEAIHVFEGFMDFLSVLENRNRTLLKEDAIILNSLSMLERATPYIKGYGYKVAYTWMDNDSAGKKATQALDDFFKTEENLRHKSMNDVYRHHKDVNEWHMKNLGL